MEGGRRDPSKWSPAFLESGALQRRYVGNCLTAVPSIILNDWHVVTGGRTTDSLERMTWNLSAVH
ncbi:hypothetical protein SAMN05414139_10062 [Burkholderia sp. D7]|nr:hypothetical protein SAMN05414139_10062 [Burkholderia sp. D7]